EGDRTPHSSMRPHRTAAPPAGTGSAAAVKGDPSELVRIELLHRPQVADGGRHDLRRAAPARALIARVAVPVVPELVRSQQRVIVHTAREQRDALTLAPVAADDVDRKSTRLNSSHVKISYAVFCLK